MAHAKLYLATPPFMAACGPGRPPVPLVGILSTDGFGTVGITTLLSGELGGAAAIAPHAGTWGVEDPMATTTTTTTNAAGEAVEVEVAEWESLVHNPDVVWSVVTTPVHDDGERARVHPGEVVANTYKCAEEVRGMVEAGILEPTGRFVSQGYYDRLPVMRVLAVRPVPVAWWVGVERRRGVCCACGASTEEAGVEVMSRCGKCKSAW